MLLFPAKKEEESLSASFQKPLKPTFDPTKPILVTNNKCITFQDLKKIYKEFQNLAREEKKNDTWDEFVNDARFQVRPDPAQERIDYVEPNFRDFRTHCPRGLFLDFWLVRLGAHSFQNSTIWW